MTKNDAIRLKGVCPILPTPFDENNHLDERSLIREVRFLLEAGVQGIALFGNASEAFALRAGEKQRISDLVRQTVGQRVPLVYGAGGTGIEPALDSCLWAQENGADLLMIMPPYMIKPDGQRIYDFYAALAGVVDIPIMIQDAPGACGVNIPVPVITRLARDCENIQYVKAEAPPTFLKAKELISATEGKLTVFGGLNGASFYEELCSGVAGTMPAGEFPDILLDVYERFMAGDRAAAKEKFYRYLPFIRLGTTPGGMAMAVHKEVLRRGGIFSTANVRNPYLPANDTMLALLDDMLSNLPLMALSSGERACP